VIFSNYFIFLYCFQSKTAIEAGVPLQGHPEVYLKTYGPGQMAPDHILSYGGGLSTVDAPNVFYLQQGQREMRLSQLVQNFQGSNCYWSACRTIMPPEISTIGVARLPADLQPGLASRLANLSTIQHPK
jgi:hypothetical protein